MKQKDVFKKIGGIIQELSEQYDYLQTVSDNLNDLELELFVANAHFLTDHIEILCKLNLQNKPKRNVNDKQETIYQQKFFEPVVQQNKPGAEIKDTKTVKAPAKPVEVEVTNIPAEPVRPEKADKPTAPEKSVEAELQPEERDIPQFDFTSSAPEDSYSVVQQEPEIIKHELILDEADTWEDEPETMPEVKAEEPVDKNEPEAPVIVEETPAPTSETEVVSEPEPAKPEPVAEEVAPVQPESEPEPVAAAVEVKKEAKEEAKEDEPITRNQKISSQIGDKTSKSEQISIKPISDIKLAITLNDKLLYVKDLFNGYNLAYSEAIEILNRFTTFEEAQRFLKTNYVTKNNWESKQTTADKFYALLKRRYA
ncbi:MAG TPA: hypothetical protein VIM55_20110 [Mucilaginibacter sp.]